jgi:hypothetical protein
VRPFDAETVLGEVVAAGDPGRDAASVRAAIVRPRPGQARWRSFARNKGGWTHAADGPTLRKGDMGPRVADSTRS